MFRKWITELFALLVGGTLGTFLRYQITHIWLTNAKYCMIPLPTLIVNSAGSFLIGFLYEIFTTIGIAIPHAEKIIFVGFLGAFTTFSMYSLESITLFREGKYKEALIYVTLSNLVPLLLVIVGFCVAKFFLEIKE